MVKVLITVSAALLTICFSGTVAAEEAVSGALENYIAQQDDSFAWVRRRAGELPGGKYAELTLTSQTWRDIVWKHQLVVIKPDQAANHRQALILIAGGRWRDELAAPPEDPNAPLPREAQVLATLAGQLQSPVVLLLHVPQQPIFDGLTEDAAISYTFEQYLRTGDPTWPLILPMVKSAVRAMDATQQFVQDEWGLEIENFTVTGASKRGWTTWLTGAVDPRANAIAPMVIDTLNMGPQMKHQLASWGRYSEQIGDYTQRGLQGQMDTRRGRALTAIVDPYAYRQRIQQPKLLLIGTNDRYWPLDALNLYWDDLKGDKYVLYVPNNGHGLNDYPRMLGTIAALHAAASGRLELPKLHWGIKENGDRLVLSVASDVRPQRVSAWVATSATRDFREAAWKSHETAANGEGFEYEVTIPAEGFAAMFGEAVYQTDHGPLPFYLSTNVRIVEGGGGSSN